MADTLEGSLQPRSDWPRALLTGGATGAASKRSRELLVALSPGAFYLAAPNDVPAVELVVSDEWQLFELPFSAFGTDGHEVANIDFVVGRDGSDADFWIDDLVFLCRDQCPKGG